MKKLNLKSKNIIWLIAVIILLAVGVFCFLACVPIKQNINKKSDGICWNVKDSEEERKVEAEIRGDYYNYIIELWNTDRFEGDIVITGGQNYNIPQVTAHFLDFKAPDGQKYVYASMISYRAESNSMTSMGDIYINKKEKLSEFVICPDGSEDMRYAFPASNREDAEKLDKKLNILMWGK